MIERDKTEEQTRLPAQQAQQPQPPTNSQTEPRAPQQSPLPEKPSKVAKPLKTPDAEQNADASAVSAALDEARFTAGVVRLYETLLKEPIPEEMLRLVEKLGKQERK